MFFCYKNSFKEGEDMSIGVIFGKFYPIHLGHIHFIQEISSIIDKLYVVVCTDALRDEKLFLESSMNSHLSNELRIKFVSDSFNCQENIEILHLKEDGITSYPDGWQSWSDRVKELFKSKDIYFDTVFCNELQDVDNYYKYFNDIKDLNVLTLDLERQEFNVSATKIRNNPYQYWEYIPLRERSFFSIKIGIFSKDSTKRGLFIEKLSNYYNSHAYEYEDFLTNKIAINSIINATKIIFFSLTKYISEEDKSIRENDEIQRKQGVFDLTINLDEIKCDEKKMYEELILKINMRFGNKVLTNR